MSELGELIQDDGEEEIDFEMMDEVDPIASGQCKLLKPIYYKGKLTPEGALVELDEDQQIWLRETGHIE